MGGSPRRRRVKQPQDHKRPCIINEPQGARESAGERLPEWRGKVSAVRQEPANRHDQQCSDRAQVDEPDRVTGCGEEPMTR
jgi:hypothetical protein